jgi:hypothetical protein
MDPITIGLAFTAAQAAVGQIKQAIALGKDIHGLVGMMGKFFEAADTVHTASTKAKIAQLGKSDAELGRQALEFAMHSNKLREDETALKNMIYWELGKPQIWEDMIKERTRLLKQKREAEREIEEAKQKHKEKMGHLFMLSMYFIGGAVIVFAMVAGGIQIYSIIDEQRIYNEKVARNQAIRLERARAEQRRQKEEALEAVR